jgi:spermidine/putrescine-binding protein
MPSCRPILSLSIISWHINLIRESYGGNKKQMEQFKVQLSEVLFELLDKIRTNSKVSSYMKRNINKILQSIYEKNVLSITCGVYRKYCYC